MNKNLPKKKDEKIDIIEQVELSPEEISSALVDAGSKSVARSIPIFDKIFAVIEQVQNELRDRKLNSLLQQFNAKLSSTDETIKRLNVLFSEPNGVALFAKITSILRSGNNDEEWIGLLSNALKHISDSDIQEKFNELEYVLSQVARLSPQALIILSKGDKWHTVKFSGATTTSNQTILGDWDNQAAKHFAQNVGVSDEDTLLMFAHTFRELESAGMVYVTPDKHLGCTQIGARVQAFITS